MIQKTSLFLLAAIAVAAVSGLARAADDAELERVRQKVAGMFEMIDPENVSRSPADGWYMIQKGSIVAYISADGRYLLQGDMIDLDQNVNMSEVARNDTRRELMASIPDTEAIVFSPEEKKYRVTVFTDVDCTYCRRLHNQINEYLAYGIEVRYLLYPRNGPASRSWNTAEDVWCSSDRNNALTMAKLDREFDTNKCESTTVQEHYVIGRDVGLSGTPAIVLDDGTMIGGYVTPDQLKAQLEQNAAR
jgi:thiol:disulfide interchange protein DsbC